MNSNNHHIQELINKYICGKATANDMQFINKWINISPANKTLFSILKKEAEEQEIKNNKDAWQCFLHKYDTQIEPPKKNKRIIRYISMAASVALVIGFSFHLLNKPKNQLLEVYQTPQNIKFSNTTLSLADGTSIPLEKEHATIEIENDGKSIIIENEDIIENKENINTITYNQLSVPYGKTAQLTLEDGTKVWLNAGSQLVFPSAFNTKSREVLLKGEGFFDVIHNEEKPFKVLTNEMTFTVLGTSFNIRSYTDHGQVDAVLVNGSLQIESNVLFNKKEVLLKPGQKSTFNISDKTLIVKEVNTKLFTSWKDGYLTLHRNNLHNLITQIENYYNYHIDIPTELTNKKIQLTGKILLYENPEQVFKALSDLIDVTYQIEDNKVIMTKR